MKIVCIDTWLTVNTGAISTQLVYLGALDGKLPRDAPLISFVVRLMQLAVDGRQMLRDRKYK